MTGRDAWMTVGEVAEELKLPTARVYKLIRDCKSPLPAHRVGERTIRIRRDELQGWLDDLTIGAGEGESVL